MSGSKRLGAPNRMRGFGRLLSNANRQFARASAIAGGCVFAIACTPLSDDLATREHPSPVHVAAPLPGRLYADEACAECHAVAAGDTRSPNSRAPTFEAIANVPGMTHMALNVALHTSHATMPNLIVTPDQIENLWAYLDTLKQ